MQKQKEVVVRKHQLYRSGGKEVVLDEVVYNTPAEGQPREIQHYVVRNVSLGDHGNLEAGPAHVTKDLQWIGRVVALAEAA